MVDVVIRDTLGRGRGVFASRPFCRGELIERCEVLIVPERSSIDKTVLYNYYFAWANGAAAIALGNGSLYNHSYTPNGVYYKHFAIPCIEFIAIKDIDVGEEILVNYSGKPNGRRKMWFDVQKR